MLSRLVKRKFHTKMDTIKDRNTMDLTEAEGIKQRWHEYSDLTTLKKSS